VSDGSVGDGSARDGDVRQRIARLALVVTDYDRALAFYVDVLGFRCLEDTAYPEEAKRWVVVAPPGEGGAELILAQARDARQRTRVGDQTGGRVFLFLETDDFERDHARYRAAGVEFVREPKHFPYGKVAVFRDPFGNLWDLIEPTAH
jgi:catechol 2,3-dioxygenase-like lactoylglutathione lyase family enzyme